jgi:vacuolar-type H+-ATPase subunit E/Vma4
MPLSEIRDRIDEESKKQAKKIHDDAQKEVEAILNEAKQKAAQISKASDEEISHETKRLELEQSARTDLLVKELELTAREQALDGEIDSARKELIKTIKGNGTLYKKLFSDAIKAASEIAPMREFTIITNRSDAELVKNSDTNVEYQSLDGGLIIRSINKDIVIDATLDKIVDSRTEEMKSMLLESMFRHEAKPAARKTLGNKNPKSSNANKKAAKPKKGK